MKEFLRLPNHTAFEGLYNNLRSYNSTLAQNAFIAADAFDMAILVASRQDRDKFGSFFNTGVAKSQTLTPYLGRSASAQAMFGWLMAAQGHSQSVSARHLARSAEDQARYQEGAQAAEAVRLQQHQVQAGVITQQQANQQNAQAAAAGGYQNLPQQSGADTFAQIAKGIGSILNPLAQAGAAAYSAKLQSDVRGAGGAVGPAAAYIPPPPAQNNTPIIIAAVVGLGAIAAVVAIAGGKKKKAPAATAARRRK